VNKRTERIMMIWDFSEIEDFSAYLPVDETTADEAWSSVEGLRLVPDGPTDWAWCDETPSGLL
jgi:hypothetical protein